MQTLAFLWFELHEAQRRLRQTFTESTMATKDRTLNLPPRVGLRCLPSANYESKIESKQQSECSGY